MDDSQFIIKPSTISNAGKGLFSRTNIKRGTTVLVYQGKRQMYHSHKNHEYCYGINDSTCINAKKSTCLARYVNDTFGHSDKPINLRCNINDDVIEMVACTDINAGDELFISYGDRYWT
jgi:hypothetical protein